MRPYRGLTKEGKWVYGFYIRVHGDRHFIAPEDDLWFVETDEYNRKITPTEFDGFIEVIPETVGQSTGLHDKNGKEIYGGNIYKDANGIIYEVKMAVDGWALFSIREKKAPIRSLYWHNTYVRTRGEIIGNIHQNPELMEQDNG